MAADLVSRQPQQQQQLDPHRRPRRHEPSSSSSVSPKVIVPSVTVIGVLVLITVVGAVFIIARAYRRRRHGLRIKNEGRSIAEDTLRHYTAGTAGGELGDFRERWERRAESWADHSWRGDDERDNPRHSAPLLLQSPEPALLQQYAGPRPFSWNARARGEAKSADRGGGAAGDTGPAIRIQEVELQSPAIQTPSPALSKIERITGNALSNDLYADRPSGAQAIPPKSASKRTSFPPWAPPALPKAPKLGLTLETDLAELSPATTNTSISQRDVSPSSSQGTITIMNALSAPPAAAPYPNMAALAAANALRASQQPLQGQSQRLPLAYAHPQVPMHIASQFNPSRLNAYVPPNTLHRISSVRSTASAQHQLAAPVSAAFGGFPQRNNSTASHFSELSTLSSASSTTRENAANMPAPHTPAGSGGGGGGLRPPALAPFQRRSWSGRSILLLDDPNGPPSPQPQTPTSNVSDDSAPPPSPLPRDSMRIPTMSFSPPREDVPRPEPSPEHRLSSIYAPSVVTSDPDAEGVSSGPFAAAAARRLSSVPSVITTDSAVTAHRGSAFLPRARPDSAILPVIRQHPGPAPITAAAFPQPPPIPPLPAEPPSPRRPSLARSGSTGKNSILSLSTISSFNTVAAVQPMGLSPGPGQRWRQGSRDEAARSSSADDAGDEASIGGRSASSRGNLTEEELAAEMLGIRQRAQRMSIERRERRRRAEEEEAESEALAEAALTAMRAAGSGIKKKSSGTGSWSDGAMSERMGNGLLF